MATETGELVGYGLYAAAYVTSLAAFVMTRITWLRIWVVFSSTCYAIYYYVFPAEPLWLDVVTELGLVLLNVAMLGLVATSALVSRFDDTSQFLYDAEFAGLSRRDFGALLRRGEWCNINPGHVFTTLGEPVEHLFYLLRGEVVAEMGNARKVARSDGTLIGEISFQSGRPASATVVATAPCLVMRWSQRDLRRLCGRNAEIGKAMDRMIASQMGHKLTTG